jgi:regulator of replication initiation timing
MDFFSEVTKLICPDFSVDQVRSSVVVLERENISLKQENASLRATLDQDRVGRMTLEQKLVEAESQLVSARVTLEGERGEIRRLKNQVHTYFWVVQLYANFVARTRIFK